MTPPQLNSTTKALWWIHNINFAIVKLWLYVWWGVMCEELVAVPDGSVAWHLPGEKEGK